MYTTSALYQSIVSGDNHRFEIRVAIAGNVCSQSEVIEVVSDYRVFAEDQPGVGGCLAGELSVRLLKPDFDIPRMALVEPYVRATDGSRYSEWIPQGKFFIDTRETSDDDGIPVMKLHCFDAMLKSEADYPSGTHEWPYSDINVVKEIAYAMGLQSSISSTAGIDPRTIALIDKGYTLGLPIGYSMREVLSQIAAMYAGNWIMNYDGQLLLVAVNGIPPETNYLIDSQYDAITFGGDRILV
ncbi:MAG: hypothetical protein IKF98_01600 [Clostridia bacterium]|nr:hypothetical protein [Clostridia bacterium]